jgi:predicted Zn-dependent protease
MILFGPAYGTLGSVALQNGLGLSIDLAILGITRKSEEEADQLGVQYLWNSGYDTAAFTSFFEKLLAKEKKKPGAFASFLRTHPPLDNRIQFSQEEARQLPGKPEYMVTSSDYDRVKARLIAIDNKQLLPSGGGKSSTGKPQLKRKTQTGEPDDKPTLKRKPTLKKDTPPDEPDKNPPSSPPPQ